MADADNDDVSAGADTDAGAGVGVGVGADADADADADTDADTDTDTDTDTDADAGADAADGAALAAQIGRPLRARATVVKRCGLGLPVVAQVPPILDSGEPFPTRYWLTCPLAHKRVARLEADGGVRDAEAQLLTDEAFYAALEESHRAYAAERDALVPADARYKPRGGVAGVAKGVKCLHAHVAHHWSGAANPVGASVAVRVGVLDCATPCVKDGKRNDAWREPKGTS